MTAVLFDSPLNDDQRRARLYAGDLFVFSPTKSSRELIGLARSLLEEAFPGVQPEQAQFHFPVEEYAAILAKVKPAFIHHPDCKRLVPGILTELGCDPDQVHFDVPRMRTSTSDGYLTTGIAYAFHPHRDTWYSAPMCQINWWIPISLLEPGNAMAFHPGYFDRGVRNDSCTYDYGVWNAKHRFGAVKHVGKDTRRQPHSFDPIQWDPNIVLCPPPGSIIAFSAAQMHSSIPNSTGYTRLSIDFRTVHAQDARELKGAVNVDSFCTGSAIDDYLRCADLAHLPADIQSTYEPGHPRSPADRSLSVEEEQTA